MKKFLLVLIILLFSSMSHAEYRIYAKKGGFFGLLGQSFILLNLKTGQTWELVNSRWDPLPIIEEIQINEIPSIEVVKEIKNDSTVESQAVKAEKPIIRKHKIKVLRKKPIEKKQDINTDEEDEGEVPSGW
ncbi:MAG: hypothetical protein FD145_811 [Candidatus Saganbacteria bacterium]|uniref:Uncharacterized protein n=1 Tax=Candidatus Saganbacteria bacterium TaxID=2575572 RepID=A0A833L3K4_UNCSA|nr:MAG: hypothetical protein FD145_811 [Candidatus Saganbacteria bacterium]